MVDSVKAARDVFTPVAGDVAEVHAELSREHPDRWCGGGKRGVAVGERGIRGDCPGSPPFVAWTHPPGPPP